MMGDNAGCLGLSHSAVNSDDQHVKQQQMFAWAACDELHVGPTLWAIAVSGHSTLPDGRNSSRRSRGLGTACGIA